MNDEQLKELQQLREEIGRLRKRLDEVDHRLEQLSRQTPPPLPAEPVAPPAIAPSPVMAEPQITPVVNMPPVIQPPVLEGEARNGLATPVGVHPGSEIGAPAAPPRESFEIRLGTYWLPRVGIAVLLTGMVLFAAWVTPRLGVAQKVAVGYLACIVLGVVGLALDRKMPQFARVLLAGSLALAYFVTYAAHFVDGFRVIDSPTVAIVMLSVVVVFIVGIAQERQSPTLGGMALFFGYYTSVASGVATFTLGSNAVLALAALFFLARNRWVTISYGAVLATYLTYMIWVWKLSRWGEMAHLIFDSGYLSAADFHLRGSFLALYWLLFTLGGVVIRRDAMAPAERNGLVTLNNAFLFVLFSLLMHHSHPQSQWQFQFPFAGALLVASAMAHRRYAPERSSFDTLFLQGLAVGTLGLVSYFKGTHLVAALALESAFLLVLSRWMRSRWIAWIARAGFTIAAFYAASQYENWDSPMLWAVSFAAAVGFVCARLERPAPKDGPTGLIGLAPLYYAVWSTLLAMAVAHEHFDGRTLPWVWTFGAVAVALVAGILRTREIGWAAHIPLAWAHTTFYVAKLDDRSWNLGPAIALVLVTLGFGFFLWRRGRRAGDPTSAASALWPYGLLAVAVGMVATWDHCPDRWQLVAFAAETLALVIAGTLAAESTFIWLSIVPMVVGAAGYLYGGSDLFEAGGVAWTNLLISLALLGLAERVLAKKAGFRELRTAIVVVLAGLAVYGLDQLVSGRLLTVAWALLGFGLLAVGFAIKQRSYRMAGLVALAFSLARAIFHDMAQVETVYRILSFIGLGVILLVLGFLYARNREKLAKWL
jgi:uncharacterized membrane protein